MRVSCHLFPGSPESLLFLMIIGPGLLVSSNVYPGVPLQTPPAWESQDNTFSTGGGLGDVDGDGDLDLFVGNGNDMDSEQDNIYYNIGGIFETVASWSSSDYDYGGHIAIGDVDSDGDIDMTVANYGNTSVRQLDDLYLNNGTGLNPLPIWNIASSDSDYSFSCAFGDVDNDGDLDLAVACGESYSLTPERSKLYLNNGGVLDTFPSWTSEIGYAYGISWGDVDSDGDLDLALGRDLGSNQIYFNTGGTLDTLPGWESTELSDWTNQIAFGDVDGDKDIDLAVSNTTSGSSNVRVYYNTGTDLETTASWFSKDSKDSYSCVAWGDVDGDGDLDLASGGWWEPVVVFENFGTALDTLPTWSWSPPNPFNLVCEDVIWGDVDNDGLVSVTDEIHNFMGQKRILYLDHYPAHSLERVIVNGDTLTLMEYAYDLQMGWVSLGGVLSDSQNTIGFDYSYSRDLDLVVTNWNEPTGNFLFLNGGVGVEEENSAFSIQHSAFRLFQNTPNPFYNSTLIRYQIPLTPFNKGGAEGGGFTKGGMRGIPVKLAIYDITGRLVTTLVEEVQEPGIYQIEWGGEDRPSGIYYYRLTIGDTTQTRKAIRLH